MDGEYQKNQQCQEKNWKKVGKNEGQNTSKNQQCQRKLGKRRKKINFRKNCKKLRPKLVKKIRIVRKNQDRKKIGNVRKGNGMA